MPLKLDFHTVPDPAGHGAALLLKGDWIFVKISDGTHTGVGEATHSGDDARCIETIRALFGAPAAEFVLEPDRLGPHACDAFQAAPDFLSATAISAIDQALWELAALRRGAPVWKLLVDEARTESVALYTTINRALTDRTEDDYRRVVSIARDQGFRCFKCAPFEAVTPDGDHVEQARYGLEILRMLKCEFPTLRMRVDFHKRFTYESFMQILPELERIDPDWIEEPFELGPNYLELKLDTDIPVAAGELDYGTAPFEVILNSRWADVVMPDVKHVGGFGPLVRVCGMAEKLGAQVSPHNPAGPVSTAASAHAAAASPAVTSLEYPLDVEGKRTAYGERIEAGRMAVPNGPGWGIDRSWLGD